MRYVTVNVSTVLSAETFHCFCLFTQWFQQNWLVRLGSRFQYISGVFSRLLKMSELSPGPGRTWLALPLNICLSPSLCVSLPLRSSTTPPGSTLPSDSSLVSSAELQPGKKLPRTKNGAVTWHSTAEEQLPSSLIETSPQPAPPPSILLLFTLSLLLLHPPSLPYCTPPDCYGDT